MRTNSVIPTLSGKLKILLVRKRKLITIASPAKLNLYLNILGKYGKKFHRIESILTRINLFDIITIQTTESRQITFSCTNKNLENSNNICVKSARLIQKECGLKTGFKIHLKKNIPAGSGLGGASSNAAHTIMGINMLLNLGLSLKDFLRYGSKLGSDVNFFFLNSPWGFITGRGEKVEPLLSDWRLSFLVIWPGIFLSTTRVYRNSNPKLTKFRCNANILKYALRKRDFHLVRKLSFNCLEESALKLSDRLNALKKQLVKEGFFCLLTGSGSALFIPFENNKEWKTTGDALGYRLFQQGHTIFRVQTY